MDFLKTWAHGFIYFSAAYFIKLGLSAQLSTKNFVPIDMSRNAMHVFCSPSNYLHQFVCDPPNTVLATVARQQPDGCGNDKRTATDWLYSSLPGHRLQR